MTKYLNVYVQDPNDEYAMSIPVEEDEIRDTVLTMLNKACLVVDAWGYGEYEQIYERVAPLANNLPINDGFSGAIYTLKIKVSKKPRHEIGDWDEFLLQGFDNYDPVTDPFDMREVLPTMGPDMLQFEPVDYSTIHCDKCDWTRYTTEWAKNDNRCPRCGQSKEV